MGFPQHGIAVAISSAHQKKALPPGSNHGAYGEKRPAAKQRFANMAGEAKVGLRGGGGGNKTTDVELKSG
jgi:hypothetical protein